MLPHELSSLRPAEGWKDVEGTWDLVDMYTVAPATADERPSVSHPFGTHLRGFITYVTTHDGKLKVHALITSTVSRAAVSAGSATHSSPIIEDVGLGDFFWSSPSEHGRLVTSYVGDVSVVKGADQTYLDHHVVGSAHPGYVGRSLRREAWLSADGCTLILMGTLGMKRGVRGVIVWQKRSSRMGANSTASHL